MSVRKAAVQKRGRQRHCSRKNVNDIDMQMKELGFKRRA